MHYCRFHSLPYSEILTKIFFLLSCLIVAASHAPYIQPVPHWHQLLPPPQWWNGPWPLLYISEVRAIKLVGGYSYFRAPDRWHRRHGAGVICLFELCNDSAASNPPPNTHTNQIFSPLNICVDEETWSCAHVSRSFCNKSSDFCDIVTFIRTHMCIVCQSYTFILRVMIAPCDCVPTRQTDVTPGLLCMGDSSRRRDPEGVTAMTTGNAFRTYWWVSRLLTSLFIFLLEVFFLLCTRLNLEIFN